MSNEQQQLVTTSSSPQKMFELTKHVIEWSAAINQKSYKYKFVHVKKNKHEVRMIQWISLVFPIVLQRSPNSSSALPGFVLEQFWSILLLQTHGINQNKMLSKMPYAATESCASKVHVSIRAIQKPTVPNEVLSHPDLLNIARFLHLSTKFQDDGPNTSCKKICTDFLNIVCTPVWPSQANVSAHPWPLRLFGQRSLEILVPCTGHQLQTSSPFQPTTSSITLLIKKHGFELLQQKQDSLGHIFWG